MKSNITYAQNSTEVTGFKAIIKAGFTDTITRNDEKISEMFEAAGLDIYQFEMLGFRVVRKTESGMLIEISFYKKG